MVVRSSDERENEVRNASMDGDVRSGARSDRVEVDVSKNISWIFLVLR